MVKFFLWNKSWLTGLLLVNLGGFLFGLYYYWQQLSVSPSWLWIFIIDCPLYALLFAVICFRHLKKAGVPRWLYYLTAVGLIKYGLWTGLVIWLHGEYFFSTAPVMYAALFPLHIGMILEGIVLVPWYRIRGWHLPAVLSWFLLNDWLDYFRGTLPLIPDTHVQFLLWESVSAGVLLSLGIFFWRYRTRQIRARVTLDALSALKPKRF